MAKNQRPRTGETAIGVPAHEAIAELLATHRLTEPMRAHRLVVEWPQLVGARVAAKTWPDGLSKRVLWVRVANSPWLHELSFMREALSAGIHAQLGGRPLFDEMRFHLGARRASDDDLLANVVRPTVRPPWLKKPPTPASPERQAEIRRESEAVEDPELRAVITRVRTQFDR